MDRCRQEVFITLKVDKLTAKLLSRQADLKNLKFSDYTGNILIKNCSADIGELVQATEEIDFINKESLDIFL